MIRKLLKLPAFLCILVIKIVYQNGIGRLLPKVCIYEPSCSVYMVHALQTHGLLKGGLLGTWRILRCHPFAKGGWDPVEGYDYDVWLAEQAEKEAKLHRKRKQNHNTDKEMQIEKE